MSNISNIVTNELSFDEHFLIIEAIKTGRSLRDIGREFGIAHQKVHRIGAAVGVYSIRSSRVGAETVEPVVEPVVKAKNVVYFYGKSAYAAKRNQNISWRKAVVQRGRKVA